MAETHRTAFLQNLKSFKIQGIQTAVGLNERATKYQLTNTIEIATKAS